MGTVICFNCWVGETQVEEIFPLSKLHWIKNYSSLIHCAVHLRPTICFYCGQTLVTGLHDYDQTTAFEHISIAIAVDRHLISQQSRQQSVIVSQISDQQITHIENE